MTIATILGSKGNEVVSAAPGDSVKAVVALLSARQIGAVPVIEDGEVVGVFSERDVIRILAERGHEALDGSVADAMTSPAVIVDPSHPVIAALSMMSRRRVRHLPVIENGALVGIVSIGDLVKHRIDRIEAEAEAMRSYIQQT
jgi:CBS domain-containing protein